MQYTIENVPGTLAEELSDLLLCNGALSATIVEHRPEGAKEEEIFKEKFGTSEFWKTCSIQCCYLLADEDDRHRDQQSLHQEQIRTALDWLDAEPTTRDAIRISAGQEIKPQNWQQAILDEYQEIRIADNLKIVPTWCTDTPTNDTTDTPTTSIVLNPGIAFGTGDHPTTRMCLQWINTLRDTNHTALLDYGTGSGVLAIAALVLNVAKMCHATDIEPLSIKASTHNATLNHVAHRFTAQLVDQIINDKREDEKEKDRKDRRDWGGYERKDLHHHHQQPTTTYDVIVANILQGPLQTLAPLLASKAHPGTLLALSGITSNQATDIQHAYHAVGFEDFTVQIDQSHDGDTPAGHRWALITATFGHV